jgi:murein DD-endopeptidase MepM/ murein hydrolase activator NlpD
MTLILIMLMLNSSVIGNSDAESTYSILEGGRVSSRFGLRQDPYTKDRQFHSGVDIAANAGTSIHPLAPGIVSFSGNYEGYGRLVVIQHGNDVTSHYAHCWGTKVRVGERVDSSTTIGFVGSTGRSTGPHVHFELRYRGTPINPELILSAEEPFHG